MITRLPWNDWNASAPISDQARGAMLAALDLAANASSVHAEGRAARHLIDEARGDIAALVGGKAENVVFTSGATEAAATLLTGTAPPRPGPVGPPDGTDTDGLVEAG